jgi:hypothetical protein
MYELASMPTRSAPAARGGAIGLVLLGVLAAALLLATALLLVRAAPSPVLEGITWPAEQIRAPAPGT